MSKPKYFDDLTLEEMFKNHDFTYQMSDDNRYYEQGRRQSELINAKLKERGGWTKELVDEWNKYAPGDKPWETSVDYPNMTWKKKYSDVL